MPRERFDHGLAIRREVLGDRHVDKAMAAMDEFSEPLHRLMTEFAWGDVWGREGVLDRRLRSAFVLGALIASHKPEELRVHIRGALNNGLSVEELRELIIQSAVYCGFPAALEATRIAQDVIAEPADPNRTGDAP